MAMHCVTSAFMITFVVERLEMVVKQWKLMTFKDSSRLEYRYFSGQIEHIPIDGQNKAWKLIFFLFQLKTKTNTIQTVFKNAIAEVEQNTNAIMEELMNKADLQNIFFRRGRYSP